MQLLQIIFQTRDKLRFGISNRLSRRISIIRNEQAWIPNLFQLSTGQTLTLNLFLTIIRDYDLSQAQWNTLNEVSGIVIIDEIELHLHSNFQYKVLPELIKIFPKVQFIITSHSPLFLLGLKYNLTESGFTIIDMPHGTIISPERFREFEEAYGYLKKTQSYEDDLIKAIKESKKPILFVEGDYDVRYLKKAAELLDKQDLLSNIDLKDGGGYGNLDKIWSNFNKSPCLGEIVPQKIMILYDCDIKKQDANQGTVFKKIIPSRNDTPIKKGIENLFPPQTIKKAKEHNHAFIDYTEEFKKITRGKELTEPEKEEINKDEKGNLCN